MKKDSRHSAVMERLRRRIELFRQHHTACKQPYGSTAMERLEMERQQTFALHQRCMQTKTKRPNNKHRQPAAASADPAGQRGTSGGGGTGAELVDGVSGTAGEQSRNSTLIAPGLVNQMITAAAPQPDVKEEAGEEDAKEEESGKEE